MNRFAKIMHGLGWAGVVLLVVVWIQGLDVGDNSPALARHSMVALAAACLSILPRFWTIAYLALAERGRKALRRRPEGPGPAHAAAPLDRSMEGERSASRIRLAMFVSGIAVAGLSGSFALAGRILVHRSSPWPHAIAGLVGIALQILALAFERRALRADAAEMEEIAAGERAARGIS